MSETENEVMTEMTIDLWEWWRNALTGQRTPLQGDEPQCGYYRGRHKNKRTGEVTFHTYAYWRDSHDGSLRCHRDGRDFPELQALEAWPFVCMHPISHEVYDSVIRQGGHWPDLNEAVTKSNMAPDDKSFDAFQEKVDDLVREAEQLIKKGPAATKEDADRAADLANRLSDLGKEGPVLRQSDPDLTPELKEAAAKAQSITTRWIPFIAKTAIYKQIKAIVIAPFLQAEKVAKEKAEAEARRAAEEAAAAAREAADEARRKLEEAQRSDDKAAANIEAQSAAEQAEVAAKVAAEAKQQSDRLAARRVTVGTRGKAVHLRRVDVVTILDRDSVLAYFKDRQEITDALQAMAEKAVKAGITPPGVKVEQDSRAA